MVRAHKSSRLLMIFIYSYETRPEPDPNPNMDSRVGSIGSKLKFGSTRIDPSSKQGRVRVCFFSLDPTRTRVDPTKLTLYNVKYSG